MEEGIYELFIENEVGCQTTEHIAIDEPNPFEISVAETFLYASPDRPAQLEALNGVRYEWTPTIGLDNSNIANPLASPAQATTYTVTGYNQNGREHTQEVTVEVLDESRLIPALLFSPNGVGKMIHGSSKTENILTTFKYKSSIEWDKLSSSPTIIKMIGMEYSMEQICLKMFISTSLHEKDKN